MIQLIINADDLGLGPGANFGILTAYSRGIVQSASLMANMSGFRAAVEMLAANPGLDPGIHFVLSAGSPVAPASQVPSLVDGEGRFLPRRTLLLRMLTGRTPQPEIQREAQAQVDTILAAGVRPSHIDGDQHVHILPRATDVVLDLAAELKLAVRVPAERLVFRRGSARFRAVMEGRNLAVKLALRALTRSFRTACRRRGILVNDHFVSTFGFLPRRAPAAEDLAYLVNNLGHGVTELMVHPGRADAEMAAFWGSARSARERAAELAALTSQRFSDALRHSGAVLTTYRAVCLHSA